MKLSRFNLTEQWDWEAGSCHIIFLSMTSKAEFGSESPDQFLFVCSTYIAPAHLATIFYKKMEQIYKNRFFIVLKKIATQVAIMSIMSLERLEAIQNSCLRRILRLRWFDFIPNKEIRSRTGCLQLSQRLRILRLRYLGHVARMEPARLPSYLLNWKPTHGKRSAGRSRSTLLHQLDVDFKTVLGDHWDIPAACKLAVNRTEWRHLLRNIHGEQADSGFLL